MLTEAELYTFTYHDLILMVKELQSMRRDDQSVYDRNIRQAARIMELEFDLRKYRRIMVEDTQETVMKTYGTVKSDVVSLDEFRKHHLKPDGGGPKGPKKGDWLSDMVWGTEFLVRPNANKTWMLARFMHAGRRERMVLVIPMRGEEPVQDDKEWLWVDPVEFCKYWELMAILLIPEKDNE